MSIRMARGVSLNLLGVVCQQACQLLIVLLLARVLGEEDLGRYVLVYAVLVLLQLAALFGFRAALTRFVAVRLADEDGGGVRALVRFSMWVTTSAAVLIAILLIIGADVLADVFHDGDLRTGFLAAAVALPAITVREACLAATQGWRSQRAFALIGWIGEPVARLCLTGLALAAGWGVGGAFLALVLSSWGSAVAAAWALFRKLAPVATGGPGRGTVREVLEFSFVSWGTTIASTGLIWAGTLFLGHLADTAAVGEYTVATRLVNLAVFVMAPISATFAPQFAHLHHRMETDQLALAYATSTSWIMRLSLPAFVVLLVFPKELLGLFGADYVDAVAVTILLASGQLLTAASGPCGMLLNMCGKVRLNLINNLAVLALNIALNLLLIPPYGIVGAAIAWSGALAAVAVARLVEVRVVLGIHPFSRTTVKALGAALGAGVAGVVAAVVFPGGLLWALLGIAIITLVYGALTALLGLDEEERAALRSIRRSRASTAAPSE